MCRAVARCAGRWLDLQGSGLMCWAVAGSAGRWLDAQGGLQCGLVGWLPRCMRFAAVLHALVFEGRRQLLSCVARAAVGMVAEPRCGAVACPVNATKHSAPVVHALPPQSLILADEPWCSQPRSYLLLSSLQFFPSGQTAVADPVDESWCSQPRSCLLLSPVQFLLAKPQSLILVDEPWYNEPSPAACSHLCNSLLSSVQFQLGKPQSLILVDEPWYNEPGYEQNADDARSNAYSANLM